MTVADFAPVKSENEENLGKSADNEEKIVTVNIFCEYHGYR
ncbi:hypothetical protein W822_04825 [Advenella kashmirensis W13003]|uniref:Uncharacterized protein n=1 Tax=Advenella kashmirensis W13003 TaxID=1424334 RepID=V8R0E1_9BURK|nr:hypothetical protein W822_04825 [Advenella kashmirensis W13003]